MVEQPKIGALNLAVVIFSIIAIFALIADTFFQLPSEIRLLVEYIDFIISIFFLFEFFYRLYHSPSKLEFLKWGWIDFISSIPMIGYLRAGRIFRLIRLFRIIKSIKSLGLLYNDLFENRIKNFAYTIFILALLLLVFSSISILIFETAPNSNIKTAEDAIWWSYCTITTVGYGDKYPVTMEGKIIAMILMTFGVGIFSTMTAYISSTFIKKS